MRARANDVAIIGYGEARNTIASGRSVYDIAGEVTAGALASAGIGIEEIDGFATCLSQTEAANPFFSPFLADCLGFELDWCQGMDLGGASFLAGVARAADAVRNGSCRTAIVLAADAPTTQDQSRIGGYRPEWQWPVGLMGPPGTFGLLASRYAAEHGLDERALAKLAVVQREHARLNDNACEKLRKPLTEDEFLASSSISDPIRRLDCVMPCDGGNALIVTSSQRARELGIDRMVHPTGYGERTNHRVREPLADILDGGHAVAGPRALAQAGIAPAAVQMFHPYDDFLIAVMLQLEHIGFAGRGGGGRFIRDTDITFRGTLPINTGGGQISAGQPGLAGGGLNAVEAVRQLFNDGGPRQVSGVTNAMVTGIGCIPYARNWSVSNVMILESGG
jgi:acetyl-CoA acetyltransferase